ncbi:MAG: hypothetical protein COB51_04520 [Moraxellaceae bacterium]|nr:MAG: hypothetical protein COB51_04520 [Moraxellaceae bacterium]
MTHQKCVVVFISLWLTLLSGFAFAAKDSKDSVFWQINGLGIKPSYLLGTIHISDPEVTHFSRALNKALQRAALICLELDMSPEVMMTAFSQMMSPNQDLEALVGPKVYQQIMRQMGGGAGAMLPIRQMKPWAVMVMLSMPKNQDPTQVMDLRIYEHARARNLPICALETVQEQLSVFDQIPIKDQVLMLKETLQFLPKMDALFTEMMVLYKAGELDKLHALNEAHMDESDSAIWGDTMVALLDRRNLRMIDRMEVKMKRQSTLVAVGALHLSGDQGLIKLLRDRGYSVLPLH